MNIKYELFKELRKYFKENPNLLRDYFVCVYGSYAASDFKEDSDLDICIATSEYSQKDFRIIKNYIIKLHIKYGLKIDEEVPYENKLLISYKDIEDSIMLEPFLEKKKYSVKLIANNKTILKSRQVRLRLILNILTTPNVFIYGNKLKYKILKRESEQAIIKLAHGLSGKTKPETKDLFKVLTTGENGTSGRSYLGYKTERKEIATYLKKIIQKNSKISQAVKL